MPSYTRVAACEDIPSGSGKAFRVDGRSVAVFNVGGVYHAIADTCPHMGASLARGTLAGHEVICPLHQWVFDVRTGCFAVMGARGVDRFPVRIEDGDILVGPAERVDEPSSS